MINGKSILDIDSNRKCYIDFESDVRFASKPQIRLVFNCIFDFFGSAGRAEPFKLEAGVMFRTVDSIRRRALAFTFAPALRSVASATNAT